MSMINKEVSDFRADAFHDGAFQVISRDDILGKWSLFFFYPADFTDVNPLGSRYFGDFELSLY